MADFRPIAPSSGPFGPSGPSRLNPFTPPGSGYGSGDPVSNDNGGSDKGHDQDKHLKRRISVLAAQGACTECRKARAKCEPIEGNACVRCKERKVLCRYVPNTKAQKDVLVQENANLQRQKNELEQQNEGLQRTHQQQATIIDVLTNNGRIDEVIRRLRAGNEIASIASWLQGQPEMQSEIESRDDGTSKLVHVVEKIGKRFSNSISSISIPSQVSILRKWTDVTENPALINHLFSLYFTWVHPVHMLFYEHSFHDSFEKGDETHCSVPLVNAICAMACHLLDEVSSDVSVPEISDRNALRTAFMEKARRSLNPLTPQLSITALQAFSVMFLVGLSSGHARSASAYLRCAADHLTKTGSRTHEPSLEYDITQWGIHTLNTQVPRSGSSFLYLANTLSAWSAITFQKPFNPKDPSDNVFFKNEWGASNWQVTQESPEDVNQRRPARAILTANYQAKLFRIVHSTINTYCGARGRITAEKVLDCYTSFLIWRDGLPEPLSNVAEGAEALPHVISMHVQYHAALVQLFLPIVECGLLDGADALQILSLMVENGKMALSLLLQGRRHFHACRFHMPLTTFCMLYSSDALIRFSPNDPPASEVIEACSSMLRQNTSGFALSGPLQQMFCRSVASYGLEIPENLRAAMEPDDTYDIDEILDSCTRLSYTQPTEQIVQFISPDLGRQWTESWDSRVEEPMRRAVLKGKVPISDLLCD